MSENHKASAGGFPKSVRSEAEAVDLVATAIEMMRPALPYVWAWGDGHGGWVISVLREIAAKDGLIVAAPRGERKKASVPSILARQVMERDAYRCVTCGSHKDLTCDHVMPESRGGATNLSNLQTMCRSCNSQKGARV